LKSADCLIGAKKPTNGMSGNGDLRWKCLQVAVLHGCLTTRYERPLAVSKKLNMAFGCVPQAVIGTHSRNFINAILEMNKVK